MITRRTFILSSASMLTGSLTGCSLYENTSLTKKLYDKINTTEHTETIDRVLLSEDGKKLVFIGPTHHYIFDAPEPLKEFLNSPLGITKDMDIDSFQADASDASATIKFSLATVAYDENAVKELAKAAKKWGFYHIVADYYRCEFSLTGTRYSAKNFNIPASTGTMLHITRMPLNKIIVSETMPIGEKAALMLLTPLTVAADGVIFLGDTILISVFISIMAISGSKMDVPL